LRLATSSSARFGAASPTQLCERFRTSSCSQLVKLKVCYFNTQSCISMDVPAYGRREGVLGIKLRERISNEFHQLSDLGAPGRSTESSSSKARGVSPPPAATQ
jgi:hypothetical protein